VCVTPEMHLMCDRPCECVSRLKCISCAQPGAGTITICECKYDGTRSINADVILGVHASRKGEVFGSSIV
jgi:hypothetical protein